MPLAQRRDEDRRLHRERKRLEPEALDGEARIPLFDLLPGERAAQEEHRVLDALVWRLEGNSVPAFDDHVRRGADAQREAPGRRLGEARGAHREGRGAAGEGGHDRGPEPGLRGPGRREGRAA
jgi:hypothetical protein